MENTLKDFDKYFVNKCKELFSFLEKEFDCELEEIVKESYGLIIYYKNRTTAIQISLEERDGGIFVELIRLVNNKIPERPIQIDKYTELHRFDLEDLLDIKKASLKIKHPPLDDLVFNLCREKVLEKVLFQCAEGLKLYASDILNGDFAIFSQLEKIVKSR